MWPMVLLARGFAAPTSGWSGLPRLLSQATNFRCDAKRS
jgi:hypothetical protein